MKEVFEGRLEAQGEGGAAGNRKAKAIFDTLAPSHKRAYTDWIAEAKKDDTRARRVAKAVEMLEAGEKRM